MSNDKEIELRLIPIVGARFLRRNRNLLAKTS
jgi:hypothetical protein